MCVFIKIDHLPQPFYSIHLGALHAFGGRGGGGRGEGGFLLQFVSLGSVGRLPGGENVEK